MPFPDSDDDEDLDTYIHKQRSWEMWYQNDLWVSYKGEKDETAYLDLDSVEFGEKKPNPTSFKSKILIEQIIDGWSMIASEIPDDVYATVKALEANIQGEKVWLKLDQSKYH